MSKTVDWAHIRRRWQESRREGFAWLSRELGGAVTPNAIRNRSLVEGWAKDCDVLGTLYGPAAQDGYRSGFATAAAQLALLGMDRHHIAAMFKVTNEQLDRWVETYPALKTAIEDGGKLAEAALVEQLHKCAVGYSYESEEVRFDEDGEIHRVPVNVTVPADPESLLFLLGNPQQQSNQ